MNLLINILACIGLFNVAALIGLLIYLPFVKDEDYYEGDGK